MTNYNKQTLGTYFQTNDVPSGTDFQNLIDSNVNLVETSVQAMAGPLSTTELIATRISAGNVIVTGSFSAAVINGTSLGVTGDVSANSILASGASFTANISAATINLTGDVSAATGTVYASAMRSTNGIFAGVGIVSAAGTTQGTAAALSFVINRGQGVTDTSTTGFAIPANKTGLVQYLTVESNVSANLWPPTGGTINNTAANTVFALAGRTTYTIIHLAASAYGVK